MMLKVVTSAILFVAIVAHVSGHTYHTGSTCPSVSPVNDFQMNSVSFAQLDRSVINSICQADKSANQQSKNLNSKWKCR